MKEKFFKLDVNKLLQKLPVNEITGQPPVFNESQLAMITGLEEHRFWVHIAARRTGKSWAAAILAFMKLLEPKKQVMVVAPNYNLSSIIWEYVTDFIKNFEIECDRFNTKDRVVKLSNGSVFRLLSANNRDSLIGRAAHLLIIDEAAVIDNPEYFERDLRPVLSTFKDSRALFISTPRGKANYLYQFFNRRLDPDKYPNWGGDHFTWRSNPLLTQEDLIEAQNTLPRTTYLQEYECTWNTYEGQIYNLDENKHLIDLEEAGYNIEDGRWNIIGGLDIGYRDETAFVVVATNGDLWLVLDDYVDKEQSTAAHAEVIKEKEADWKIETIYIDTAAQQSKMDLAYDHDIFCQDSIKDVKAGIDKLRVLVDRDKIYFCKDKARRSFEALAAYHWNMNTQEPKPVHDSYSHFADALRYAVYTYTQSAVDVFVGNTNQNDYRRIGR